MLLKSLVFIGGVAMTAARVQFMGINIAGFEFGCQIDGSCPTTSVTPPLSVLGGGDGAGQMQHFMNEDQMNIFPVSWQFLVNNKLGGTLDSTNFGKYELWKYDQLMQSCLFTGAYCAIDLHNFARFNGNIIGQSSSGPSDAQFVDLWTQLATKYKSNTKVVFGLMNEPHDVNTVAWASTVQLAVTAIRNAGASTQMILLPGNNFTSAATSVSNGSNAALIKVTNPDGSTDGLILDIHKYLDVDNSGTHADCTTDNISDAFSLVAAFLRASGRQVIVDFCAQNTFLNQNSDVFLGYIAWGAGSFATSYTLSLTPSKQNGQFIDNALASHVIYHRINISPHFCISWNFIDNHDSISLRNRRCEFGNSICINRITDFWTCNLGVTYFYGDYEIPTSASVPPQLANGARMEEISRGFIAVTGAITVDALLR
ncbi:Endoglucanase EG-II [Lachnellula cervina]|uniref:cellulase n=1 Tax=Lachnellula cervina TaxID=1316786 RepID=A0A7D8UIX5_9HELO|nr:Endoglucanase EG-II [Lachnellula cervina]